MLSAKSTGVYKRCGESQLHHSWSTLPSFYINIEVHHNFHMTDFPPFSSTIPRTDEGVAAFRGVHMGQLPCVLLHVCAGDS